MRVRNFFNRVVIVVLASISGSITNTFAADNVGSNNDDGTCDSIARRDISPPKIELFRVKEKAPESSGEFRLSGSVEGVCIAGAGYYEKGILRQPIPTAKTRSFRRFQFELTVRLEDKPEIRVTNVANDSQVLPVKAAKSDAEWQETYEDRYHGLRDR